MARIEDSLISERQYTLLNAAQKNLRGTTGKISSSNRALEDHIAAKNMLAYLEADVSGRMSGSQVNLELETSQLQDLVVGQFTINGWSGPVLESKELGLSGEGFIKMAIIGMEVNGSVVLLPHPDYSRDVIHMGMGQQDRYKFSLPCGDQFQYRLHFVTRVNVDDLAGIQGSDQVAVLVEGLDGP